MIEFTAEATAGHRALRVPPWPLWGPEPTILPRLVPFAPVSWLRFPCFTDAESASMWQSPSFGANYKAAYCLAVCPADEEVRPPFDRDLERVVRPLQQQPEVVYVAADSDAEAHVRQRFPQKCARRVRSGLRPADIRGFLASLPLVFNPGQSRGLAARYHFVFTGAEPAEATIVIER